MEHPERPAEVAARDVIAHLQQSVHALMDADRVLPADGSSLLAALDRALDGLNHENALAAQAGIAVFVGQVQALIAAGALDAGDAQMRIATATAVQSRLQTRSFVQADRPEIGAEDQGMAG